MDTIWNSATGMDIDCQSNLENPYMDKALLVFKDLEELKFAFKATSYLNEFRPFLLGLLSLQTFVMSKFNSNKFEEFVDPLFWLTQHIQNVIDERKDKKVF